MTEKEKTLWKEAIKYVDEHYGDCPDYIRLVFIKFDELNNA